MGDIAIRAENLSKQYKIGKTAYRHDTLRDRLAHGLKDLILPRRQPGIHNTRSETFWALNDVSFEIKHGEVVGIIGGNGAGKSTLLKILSRITEPTKGRAEIYGRVGSLLEVGTGFHPELTGRENIYLNGAILGMKKVELDAKFEEIVDFAEIGQFIDTPVKRYSSGMYVRLAFAVAAHLEPEILIVDEVLAVGDVGFQKKCLGRMRDVAGHGRTVLFVSHNIAAVRSLCDRCLLLRQGVLQMEGPADVVVAHFNAQYEKSTTASRRAKIEADREGYVYTRDDCFLYPKDQCTDLDILCGDPITLEFDLEIPKPITEATVGITISTISGYGSNVVSMSSKVQNIRSATGVSQFWTVRCDMGRLPLNAGVYLATVFVGNGLSDLAQFSNAFSIQVREYDVFGWGNSLPGPKYWGPLYWAPQWEIAPVSPAVTPRIEHHSAPQLPDAS
jgi:lipopolysaccharide transport system ATP-binding protein